MSILLRKTYHDMAAQLFESGAPLGTEVETSTGVKYLHAHKKKGICIPYLSRSKKHRRLSWNNCYAYAFNDYVLNSRRMPQPGVKSGRRNRKITCTSVINAVLRDHPEYVFLGHGYSSLRKIKPRADAVYLRVSSGRRSDYHFYKRARGVWTHKPGLMPVSARDGSGKPIRNPDKANHQYKNRAYDTPCGYFARRNLLV